MRGAHHNKKIDAAEELRIVKLLRLVAAGDLTLGNVADRTEHSRDRISEIARRNGIDLSGARSARATSLRYA